MNDLGIRTDWRTLHTTPNFFEVTKKFRSALQGNNLDFSDEELQLYTFINKKFAQYALLNHDVTVIHDPQPCALAHFVPHTAPWAWRFMEPFINEYDYNLAGDGPESIRIYEHKETIAQSYLERGEVAFIRGEDPILVNVMQSVSDVVLQKSTREGFGLVVTAALWGKTPVAASKVGGIPIQVIDGDTGFLVRPLDIDECAEIVVMLLEDKDLSHEIGARAREHVRYNFLVTPHLLDYLNLIISL